MTKTDYTGRYALNLFIYSQSAVTGCLESRKLIPQPQIDLAAKEADNPAIIRSKLVRSQFPKETTPPTTTQEQQHLHTEREQLLRQEFLRIQAKELKLHPSEDWRNSFYLHLSFFNSIDLLLFQ